MSEKRTKEELLERARELEVEGRSDMNKAELEAAVAEAEAKEGDSEEAEGKRSDEELEERGVDPDAAEELESDVLSPAEAEEAAEERLDVVEEEAGEETAELVEGDLDKHGPLLTQPPSQRVMTGAVSEEHAKEQEELLSEQEHKTGLVTESGDQVSYDLSGYNPNDVKQEDVIDYPEPRQEGDAGRSGLGHGSNFGGGGAADEDGVAPRAMGQKGVFYTDGLSGAADHNLERAYQIPEVLQSSDPEVRAAGDENEPELEGEEKELADRATDGEYDEAKDRLEESREDPS
jgi:hypothetical protein